MSVEMQQHKDNCNMYLPCKIIRFLARPATWEVGKQEARELKVTSYSESALLKQKEHKTKIPGLGVEPRIVSSSSSSCLSCSAQMTSINWHEFWQVN